MAAVKDLTLKQRLSDPVTKHEIAELLGIGISSVYNSWRRYDAARRAGDELTMRNEIPCIRRGGIVQPDGVVKGGRFITPRDAFIRWYESAGQSAAGIVRMYGGGAA